MNQTHTFNSTILAGLRLAALSLILGIVIQGITKAVPVTDSNQRGVTNSIVAPMANSSVTAEVPAPTSTPLSLPSNYLISGGTHVFQTFNNCGPASLSMLLSHHGVTISQEELGMQLRPFQHPTGDNDDKSVTTKEIAKKGEELGFQVYHRPAGTLDVLKSLIANDLPVLTRTWLNVGEDIGHYRVIKGFDDERQVIIQDDSLQGKDLSIPYTEFMQMWSGFNYEYIVLSKSSHQEIEMLLGTHTNPHAAWEDALTLSTLELEQNPGHIFARFNQSVAYYYLADYSSAINSFEVIEAKLPPRMLWYQIEPLMAYYWEGRFDEVLPRIEEILTNNNRAFSELYHLRGLIYTQQGQAESAQAEFDRARYYNSTSTIWQVNLNK
jgi:predicted double-glycine peptidase